MSRILLAWELGGSYGHVSVLLQLARALATRGHEPVLALHDVSVAERIAPDHGFRILQAPLWLNEVGGLPAAEFLGDTLLRFGFHDPVRLTGVARAWREVVDMARPDLIVADYAPTALLATRGLRIPRATIGSGFCIPPDFDPWPAFRWWNRATAGHMQESRHMVMNTANAVLARLVAPPLERLSDLFDTDEAFLLTFAETDHYPDRPGARYLGPLFSAGHGAAPRWPLGGEGRIFAYLRPRHAAFDTMLHALARCGASVVIHAPGMSSQAVRSHTSATLSISEQALDIEKVRRECDFAVCHGGIGTTCAMLLAGKPLFLLPWQMEQLMLAKRIESLGAGVVQAVEGADSRRLLKRLLNEHSFGASARAFAEKHADYAPEATLNTIADRCHELVSGIRP